MSIHLQKITLLTKGYSISQIKNTFGLKNKKEAFNMFFFSFMLKGNRKQSTSVVVILAVMLNKKKVFSICNSCQTRHFAEQLFQLLVFETNT